MLVSKSIIYTHTRLAGIKHKIAMAVFHAISDEISDEVDVTLGPMLSKLHDAIDESHPAYPYIHFMATERGQLKALAGTGAQISGLLGSISAIMNNELADTVYSIIHTNPHLLPDTSAILQMAAASLISDTEAQDAIGSQGISNGWSSNMLTLARSYPSPADGLEMLRRGLTNADEFRKWCELNLIPDEVAGFYAQMVNGPISVADAALAVLRGNLSAAEGEAIAAENGFSPESFQILINNTGEPPGLEQLLEAYRRGFISKATLEQGIKDSRYRNDWIPMLEQLRYSPMSVADAVNATVQDQMDSATMTSIADQNGLTPGAVQVLYNTAGEPLSRTEMEELFNRGLVSMDQVNQALRESRVKNKYVGLAFELHSKVLPIYTVQSALRYGGMSEATAVEAIMKSGYSKSDATEIVHASSKELLKPYRDKIVSAVQSLYEDNLIDASTASNAISSAGFSADQAAYITQSSEMRREAHFISTAVNAIKAKYLSHHITINQASGYLDQFQVPPTQRDQLLGLWAVEEGAFTRNLTPAQILKAVKLTLITADDGLSRLIAEGYSKGDAQLLIDGA